MRRIFPLYRPKLPFLARFALLHLIFFGVLTSVLFIGDQFEELVFGEAGMPEGLAVRVEFWFINFGTFFESHMLYRAVLIAISAGGAWMMVGSKIMEPNETETGGIWQNRRTDAISTARPENVRPASSS
jgi:hypothetical protein